MGDPRSEIRQSEDDIWDRAVSALRRSQKAQFWSKLILILVGGTLSVLGGLLEKPAAGAIAWKYILGFGGGGMVLFGGVLLLVLENDGPELLNRMRRHLSLTRSYLDDRDSMMAKENWREHCSVALTVVIQAVEAALLAKTTSAKLSIQSLLDVACGPLLLSMRMTVGEDWTISVFRRTVVGTEEEMVRIAQRWKDEASTQSDNRTWKPHQGYTGEAWSRNKPVFVADTASPGAKEEYQVPPEKLISQGNAAQVRPDEERYRSVAALPIRVGNDAQPWGILTVTSDQPQRFDVDERTMGGANKPMLRHLAASIALIAATKKDD